MMTNDEILRALRQLSHRVDIVTAKVTAVDSKQQVCTVEISADVEMTDVRLRATIDGAVDGVFIVPKISSHVVVGYINGDATDAFVMQYSAIEEVVLMDGENNGLVKVKELTTALNKLQEDLNGIKTVFKSWVPVPQDGGASLKTASASWAAQTIIKTNQKDIENEFIKH